MNNTLDYVGIAPCGCIKVWISQGTPNKELRKGFALILRHNLSLERRTTEEARKSPIRCEICNPPKPADPQHALDMED